MWKLWHFLQKYLKSKTTRGWHPNYLLLVERQFIFIFYVVIKKTSQYNRRQVGGKNHTKNLYSFFRRNHEKFFPVFIVSVFKLRHKSFSVGNFWFIIALRRKLLKNYDEIAYFFVNFVEVGVFCDDCENFESELRVIVHEISLYWDRNVRFNGDTSDLKGYRKFIDWILAELANELAGNRCASFCIKILLQIHIKYFGSGPFTVSFSFKQQFNPNSTTYLRKIKKILPATIKIKDSKRNQQI